MLAPSNHGEGSRATTLTWPTSGSRTIVGILTQDDSVHRSALETVSAPTATRATTATFLEDRAIFADGSLR